MNQGGVRRLILKALFSDEWLYDRLILKGGNALALVYNVGGRTSLDLDFSIADDFKDIAVVAYRMRRSLELTFDQVGVTVFDFGLTVKPRSGGEPWWGGYVARFKLIPDELARSLSNDLDQMRRQALVSDAGSQRRWHRVEISKFEYVPDAERHRLGDFDVYGCIHLC